MPLSHRNLTIVIPTMSGYNYFTTSVTILLRIIRCSLYLTPYRSTGLYPRWVVLFAAGYNRTHLLFSVQGVSFQTFSSAALERKVVRNTCHFPDITFIVILFLFHHFKRIPNFPCSFRKKRQYFVLSKWSSKCRTQLLSNSWHDSDVVWWN